MNNNEVSITIKLGQAKEIIPIIENGFPKLDVYTLDLSVKQDVDITGRLLTIKDDLLNYGSSYFLRYKTGFIAKKAVPLLFADENLKYIGRIILVSPKNVSYGNQHLLITKRRLIVIDSQYALSFWYNIDMIRFLNFVEVNYEIQDYQLLNAFISLKMHFLKSKWGFGDQITLGWKQEGIRTIDNKKNLINPFRIRGSILGKGSYRRSSQELCETILTSVENGSQTDFVEILAMESYCIASTKLFYHPIQASPKSVPLKSGRLNLGYHKLKN
ncbi:hypothetical protein [Candidatus Hodarchaeum mangrovi]